LFKDFVQQCLRKLEITGKLTDETSYGLRNLYILLEKRIKTLNLEVKSAVAKRKPIKVLLTKLPEIEPIDIELPENWFQNQCSLLLLICNKVSLILNILFILILKDNGEVPKL
jgi:hypothetical protein